MNGLVIVFCYSLLLSQSRIQVLSFPKVTNPPVSVTAFLDTWVSFHCEGEGEILVWQTNGVLLTDEIKETRNITTHPSITTPGIVNSTLVIFAKPENYGLNIVCIIALNSSFVFDSAGADLFVRGIRPVEDLEFNINMNESAMVLWNSPSFVADDVIDLSYQVIIITDNNTIVVNDTTYDREYDVSIDILSLCSIYTVTVTAYDESYTSDSSIIQEGYTGEYSVSIIEKYIFVEESGNFMVVFEIMLIGRCCSFITGITKLNVPDGIEMKHNTEYVEPKDDNVIFNYTVHGVAPQQNYTFECLIKDKLNTITANDAKEFTTNHVQNVVINPDNEVLHVLCEFAKNSNASGCGLNFTKREDTTVILYSKWIVKNHDSDEAEGYISLPNNIGGNLTVIAFDVLENKVSDKAAVIYNKLPEIEILPAKPIQTNTVNIVFNSTSFSSFGSLLYLHTTVVVYHEVSSNTITEISSIPKSTSVVSNSKVAVITIPTVTVFIFIVMIIVLCVIIGIVKKIRRSRQNNNNGVCDDDINRNPAYEQVMLQRVVLSENQAYASIRNEREHNSTIRNYENIPRIL